MNNVDPPFLLELPTVTVGNSSNFGRLTETAAEGL
jgi:hypothetical protein